MSDGKRMQGNCIVCGDALSIEESLNWDAYMANSSKFNFQIIGYRCEQCGAIFCFDKHQKEMKIDLKKGFRRTAICTKCESSMKNSEVLIGKQVKSELSLDQD